MPLDSINTFLDSILTQTQPLTLFFLALLVAWSCFTRFRGVFDQNAMSRGTFRQSLLGAFAVAIALAGIYAYNALYLYAAVAFTGTLLIWYVIPYLLYPLIFFGIPLTVMYLAYLVDSLTNNAFHIQRRLYQPFKPYIDGVNELTGTDSRGGNSENANK